MVRSQMQIIARCPRCGSAWALDGTAADRRVRCPQCAKLFKVPALADIPKAAEVIRHAKSPLFVDEEGKTYG
jgi:DNA-directed RNA polymerase subunit RPC12/RpoP